MAHFSFYYAKQALVQHALLINIPVKCCVLVDWQHNEKWYDFVEDAVSKHPDCLFHALLMMTLKSNYMQAMMQRTKHYSTDSRDFKNLKLLLAHNDRPLCSSGGWFYLAWWWFTSVAFVKEINISLFIFWNGMFIKEKSSLILIRCCFFVNAAWCDFEKVIFKRKQRLREYSKPSSSAAGF